MAKNERITLRLMDSEKDFLRRLAISNGTNMTTELARLIRESMETRPDIMKVLRAVGNQN